MFLLRAWCRNVTGSLKQVQKVLRGAEQVGDETRHSWAPVYGIESGCRTGCSDMMKNAVVCGRYFPVTPVALLHAYYRSVPPFSKHSDCHRVFDLIVIWYYLIFYDTIWINIILSDTKWYYLILQDSLRYYMILSDTICSISNEIYWL